LVKSAARAGCDGHDQAALVDALGREAGLPLDEWLDFCGDTATREQMVHAAATAASALHARVPLRMVERP
jgi:hypothetical protein